MSDIAIKFENISKQYRLGTIGTGTLSHDLNRWWAMNIRGKEDPYLKIGDTNDRATKGESDYIWALRDINFEVKQGEVLGIIGKNGAGKSTLLKILSKVTTPTTGTIKARGRIASLLEIGTGFHPEMTGRENIYMNGAIMGMSKTEITRKLDEIVDFSGVERYIDTPVKRYSSGMTVRLGFAVAAHLEPEILVVDEVLAVGDAEFQKKAIGKMQDISKGEGRTVLFVSHNMAAVKSLCNKGVLLTDGNIKSLGSIDSVLNSYLTYNSVKTLNQIETSINRSGNGKVIFSDFYLERKGQRINTVITGENIEFCFILKVGAEKVKNVDIGFSIHDIFGDTLSVLYSSFQQHNYSFIKGYNVVKCTIPNFCFTSSSIQIYGRILENGLESDWFKDPLGIFEVELGDFYNSGKIHSLNNINFLIKGIWSQ